MILKKIILEPGGLQAHWITGCFKTIDTINFTIKEDKQLQELAYKNLSQTFWTPVGRFLQCESAKYLQVGELQVKMQRNVNNADTFEGFMQLIQMIFCNRLLKFICWF